MMDLFESLDGWWHAFFDPDNTRRYNPSEPQVHPTQSPSVDWDYLDDHKESVRVPGIWRDTSPGFSGVVWYWRPLVLLAGWSGGTASVHFAAVHGQAELYLDGIRIAGKSAVDLSITAALGPILPDRLYTLALWVAYPDDSGGICGPVSLIYSQRESD
jgi:hypothetical protein